MRPSGIFEFKGSCAQLWLGLVNGVAWERARS
jgi:hypothetical protein